MGTGAANRRGIRGRRLRQRPVKLHYPWTLWRTGHAHRSAWTIALEASRPFFDPGRLGLADLILVTIPEWDTLIRRRDGDTRRQRRNFDLHVQLAAALAEWYRASEQLDPARVIWRLPPEGLPSKLPPASRAVESMCSTLSRHAFQQPDL